MVVFRKVMPSCDWAIRVPSGQAISFVKTPRSILLFDQMEQKCVAKNVGQLKTEKQFLPCAIWPSWEQTSLECGDPGTAFEAFSRYPDFDKAVPGSPHSREVCSHEGQLDSAMQIVKNAKNQNRGIAC